MYIPKYYRMNDRDQISAVLTAYPFGIVVAYEGGKLLAAHVPWEWQEKDGRLELQGHVARGNPIWRAAPQCEEVLVIFQGPHTYVSSSWYERPNVPTWNYVAVHAYGTARVVEDEELEAVLDRMLDRYEGPRENGRTWETLDPAFRQQQMRGIVGLSIAVTRIEAIQKMSQNRDDGDFKNVVEALRQSPHPSDGEVAKVMERVRPQLFDDTIG